MRSHGLFHVRERENKMSDTKAVKKVIMEVKHYRPGGIIVVVVCVTP